MKISLKKRISLSIKNHQIKVDTEIVGSRLEIASKSEGWNIDHIKFEIPEFDLKGKKINFKLKEKFEEKLVDLVLSKHWDFMEKIKCD